MKPPSVAQTMLKFTTERVGILCGSRDASARSQVSMSRTQDLTSPREGEEGCTSGSAPRHGRDECGSPAGFSKVKRHRRMEMTKYERRLSQRVAKTVSYRTLARQASGK